MRAKQSRAWSGGESHALWFAPMVTLAITAPLNVQAQSEPSAESIEQVIVTARKRDESLLDVPISISAVTEDMMARNAMRSVADVAHTGVQGRARGRRPSLGRAVRPSASAGANRPRRTHRRRRDLRRGPRGTK